MFDQTSQAKCDNPTDRPFRAAVYIDGYNLYYGLREARLQRYYWLDLLALSHRLITDHERLVCVRYFTTRVPGPKLERGFNANQRAEGSHRRQGAYLDALATMPEIVVRYGKFIDGEIEGCPECNTTWVRQQEKETDVNLATSILMDAVTDRVDSAYMICGDSDQAPTFRAVRELQTGKKLIAVFPPKRVSLELKGLAHRSLIINENMLRNAQLPDSVTTVGGVVTRPDHWKRKSA